MRNPLPAVLLLLASPWAFASPARAEGPVAPGGGGSPEEEIARLSIKISRALKENEEALARLARGEKGMPKAVDLSLPKHNHEGGT